MKKVLVAVLLVVGLTTFAQEKNEKREKLTPEQQTELHLKKMTLDLDLSDSQKKEMKVLLLEQAKKREAKMTEMKSHKEKGEKPTTDERYAMKNKMLDEQIAMKGKMKKILTPEQMKKWEANKENMPQKMQHKKREMKHKE
jgi:periplasmic protein CpxP/Spy